MPGYQIGLDPAKTHIRDGKHRARFAMKSFIAAERIWWGVRAYGISRGICPRVIRLAS
jgi:hypothetical protein